MDPNRIKEHADYIRNLANWANRDYAHISVSIEQSEYYLDLGEFGESYTSVCLEDDSYEVDPESILAQGSFYPADMENIADELDELADNPPEVGLEAAFEQLEANGEKGLAYALRAVVSAVRGGTPGPVAATNGGTFVGPAPWPGALRPDIDYTAADFPQRFQPPPGFAWVTDSGTVVPYENAVAIPAERAEEGHKMVLDDKGRVKWCQLADGDYTSGSRWLVWHEERDGLPCARSMNGSTFPRAINSVGAIITEKHTEGIGIHDNWEDEDDALAAARLLNEREGLTITPITTNGEVAFEPPAPVA